MRALHTKGIRAAALVLLVFAAVALASSREASALTTPVDKWILSGDTITVEDQTFTIYLSSKTNQILADYGKGSLFISNNSCESTGNARVCLDNVQYDFTGKVMKVKVRGISLSPVIAITRTASKSEAIVSDAVLFSVALSNTGGLARNITYTDLLPKELVVTETDGILLVPDRAVWTGRLAEGESISFTYKVKALRAFEGSLVASLKYNDGSKLKTIYSSGQTVTISQAVSLYAGIGSTTALIGERNNITINLTNSLQDTVTIAPLEVIFDPGIKVTSLPFEFKKITPWDYVWNGEMARVTNQSKNVSISNLTNAWVNTTKSWFFEFKGANAGVSGIRVRASYKGSSDTNMTAVPEKKQSVAVSNKDVIVRNSLKEATMESGQRRRIKVWLQNLNPYAELSNVHANISTDLAYLPDVFLGKMGAGEQVLLADQYFYAPKANASTGHVIGTNVSYFTEFGDNFSREFKDTATVLPTQDVTLTQTLSRTTAKAGDNVEVAVVVRNSRPTNLRRVFVFDNVSSEFALIGKSQATVDVPSKGIVTAYTYKLRVDHIGRGAVLYVNTTLRYSDAYSSDTYADPQNYEFAKITPVAVEPDSLPLTITRSLADSVTYVGQVFGVKYVITNTAADKVARNILLKLPLAYGFDLVDSGEPVQVSELAPAESVVISDAEKRRAKFSGEIDFPMAGLEYENIYGDKYAINGTATSLSVKDNYVKGPVILLEKLAPQSANNTDTFGVQLKVKNTGTEPADVVVEDDGRQYTISVQNKTEYVINESSKYVSVGRIKLPQATAAYSINGVIFKTASKPATIEIFDNPVLGVDKQVPANVTNIDTYSVLLKLKNRAQKPVRNITVSDGGRSWHIDEIPGEGQANITYQDTATLIGHHFVGQATAAYTYENSDYLVQSNTAVIDVAEKSLIAITKHVTPANATKGEKIKVSLHLKNLQDEEIDALVADNDKSFSVKLPPNGEHDLSYDSSADQSSASPASATYTYKGQQLTALSPSPGFSLVTEKAGAAEEAKKAAGKAAEKGKSGSGIFSQLIRALLSVLTWKRGG